MKWVMLMILLSLGTILTVLAQSPYALETLKNATDEELALYLGKAEKLQHSGKTVTIAGLSIIGGTALTVGGVALMDQGDWALGAFGIALVGGLAGVTTLLVGVSMNQTGKERIKRINTVKKGRLGTVLLEFQPVVLQKTDSRSTVGLGVTIKF